MRGAALLVGLTGYGFSMAMMVRAGLGLDPWDVFHQGLARHTGLTIGVASAGWHLVLTLAAGHAGRWITPRIRRGLAIGGRLAVLAIAVHLALG